MHGRSLVVVTGTVVSLALGLPIGWGLPADPSEIRRGIDQAATCSSDWGVSPTPNFNRMANALNAVAAASETDAWAVGYYVAGASLRGLAQHWDGTAWSVVPSGNIGTSTNNYLYGVAALPEGVEFAVGSYTPSANLHVQTLALQNCE